MPVYYDANGNPIIYPQQKSPQANLPPEVPSGDLKTTTTGNQGQQLTQQQSPPQGGSDTNQTGSISGALGSVIQSLMRAYQNRQNTGATPVPGGGYGGGYYAPGGQYYVGASPSPGISGNIYPNQAAATQAGDVGPGSGSVAPQSGMSKADKLSMGMGLISQAEQVGAPLQNYAATASWKMQPSAIPDPSQFVQQEQQAEQQYDFQRQRIV